MKEEQFLLTFYSLCNGDNDQFVGFWKKKKKTNFPMLCCDHPCIILCFSQRPQLAPLCLWSGPREARRSSPGSQFPWSSVAVSSETTPCCTGWTSEKPRVSGTEILSGYCETQKLHLRITAAVTNNNACLLVRRRCSCTS